MPIHCNIKLSTCVHFIPITFSNHTQVLVSRFYTHTYCSDHKRLVKLFFFHVFLHLYELSTHGCISRRICAPVDIQLSFHGSFLSSFLKYRHSFPINLPLSSCSITWQTSSVMSLNSAGSSITQCAYLP